jgi:hypothetical protein
MFEDWSVDVDQADDDEAAGRTDRTWPELPSERHWELLALLYSTSHRDRAGRLVSWWPREKLAAKLGVTARHLGRLLADLREPGSDPRHRQDTPPGLRLGLVKVEPTMREPPTGGRLYAGNLYVLVEHQIPRSYRQATRKPPLSSEDGVVMSCLNEHPTLSLEGEGEPLPRVSSTPTVVEVGSQQPDRWPEGHPTRTELLETLAPLGPLQGLGEWPTGQTPPRHLRRWRTKEEVCEARRRARRRRSKP